VILLNTLKENAVHTCNLTHKQRNSFNIPIYTPISVSVLSPIVCSWTDMNLYS